MRNSNADEGRTNLPTGSDAKEAVEAKPRRQIRLELTDAARIPEFVLQQKITERGSLELVTPDGTFFVRVMAVQPDPDAAALGRADEWDREHVTYDNLNFEPPIHAYEHNQDTTHGMVQLPWVSMKPGTRYAIAVMADEASFGEPQEFTDEPNNTIGGDLPMKISALFTQNPLQELKSGTRTPAFASTVRIDGDQPLNVIKTWSEQRERLALIGRNKDEALGREVGIGFGAFDGLVEDDGNTATHKPLIIEDAPSTLPGTGTAESKNGLTTVAFFKTHVERVTRITRVPNPEYRPPSKLFRPVEGGSAHSKLSMYNFGEGSERSALVESKTVFGKAEEIEVNTVTTTGNHGMAGAFQFRIVVEGQSS